MLRLLRIVGEQIEGFAESDGLMKFPVRVPGIIGGADRGADGVGAGGYVLLLRG